MSNPPNEVLGRMIDMEMDSDHSSIAFVRKGKIVHIFSNPPAKQAIAVQLEPPVPVRRFLSEREIEFVILRYRDQTGIRLTFERGMSYAGVLEVLNKSILTKDTYRPNDVRKIGAAAISPWHESTQ